MKSLRWVFSYILVAVLGLWLAFFASMKLIGSAHSAEDQSLPTGSEKNLQKIEDKNSEVNDKKENIKGNSAILDKLSMEQKGPETKEAVENGLLQDTYFYDPTSKRDPFRPFYQTTIEVSKNVDVGRDKKNVQTTKGQSLNVTLENPVINSDPIQAFDLDELQIVGILWDIRRPRAMIKTPKSDLITVYKNSKIGKDNGVVLAIREGEIVVSETRIEDGKVIRGTRIKEIRRNKN